MFLVKRIIVTVCAKNYKSKVDDTLARNRHLFQAPVVWCQKPWHT